MTRTNALVRNLSNLAIDHDDRVLRTAEVAESLGFTERQTARLVALFGRRMQVRAAELLAGKVERAGREAAFHTVDAAIRKKAIERAPGLSFDPYADEPEEEGPFTGLDLLREISGSLPVLVAERLAQAGFSVNWDRDDGLWLEGDVGRFSDVAVAIDASPAWCEPGTRIAVGYGRAFGLALMTAGWERGSAGWEPPAGETYDWDDAYDAFMNTAPYEEGPWLVGDDCLLGPNGLVAVCAEAPLETIVPDDDIGTPDVLRVVESACEACEAVARRFGAQMPARIEQLLAERGQWQERRDREAAAMAEAEAQLPEVVAAYKEELGWERRARSDAEAVTTCLDGLVERFGALPVFLLVRGDRFRKPWSNSLQRQLRMRYSKPAQA